MSKGLFGIYRWFLAATVVAAHIAPLKITQIGYYSVFAFFTLSAYLATLNLTEKYNARNGQYAYFLNRASRIYPIYLLSALLGLIAIKFDAKLAHEIHGYFNMPQRTNEKIVNIFLLGFTDILGNRSTNVFIPPAWSLSVEIYFWCLMPVVFKQQKILRIWTIFTFLFSLIFIIAHADFQYRYYSPLGCSLAFCVGFWLYKARNLLPKASNAQGLLAVLALFIVYGSSHLIKWEPFFHGFYLAFIINIFVIHYLSNLDKKKLPKPLVALDNHLGNISYAIFLLHMILAFVTKYVFPNTFELRTFKLFFFTFGFTNIIAVATFYGLEQKIYQKLKYRL